jgi:hypothetical protein
MTCGACTASTPSSTPIVASDFKYTSQIEVVTAWPPKLVLIVATNVVIARASADSVACVRTSGGSSIGSTILEDVYEKLVRVQELGLEIIYGAK